MIGFETAEDDDDDGDYVMIARSTIEVWRAALPQLLDICDAVEAVKQAAAVRKRGRPLSPKRERFARWMAAYYVEQSTLPMIAVAADWRVNAARQVANRQYSTAGTFRRVAEIIEARFKL